MIVEPNPCPLVKIGFRSSYQNWFFFETNTIYIPGKTFILMGFIF